MQRHFLNQVSSLLAVGLIAALSSVACSSGSTATPPGSGGTVGSGTGGTVSGTGGAGTGGSNVTGSGGDATGSGGQGSGGSGDASVDMGGGSGGAVAMAPACAPTTQTSTGGLSIRRNDINARKVMNAPAADLTKIEYDPMNKVIVAMSKSGKFWKIDPVANTATPIETNYNFAGDHRGLAFAADGTMYVLSATDNPISATLRKGVGAMGSRTWSTLASTASFPMGNGTFDHNFSGLAVSPDGKYVFFSSGSRSDHGEVEMGVREVPLSSAIFRVPTDAVSTLPNDDAMLKAKGYMFADGTRNAFDMAFNADGDLIATDNGPDISFPDEVNWIQEGKHYGFPWRLGTDKNPNMDPTYTPDNDNRLPPGGSYQAVGSHTYFYEPGFPPAPTGVAFTDPIINHGPDANKFMTGGKAGTIQQGTMAGVTPHRSPLGIAFDKGSLCGDYYKAGFMLSYGAVLDLFNDHGEDLLLLKLTKNGDAYEMTATQIAAGIKQVMDDVLVGNKLYTVGWMGGSIYEFTFPLPK
ncbi:MAG TPA: PQQ-dependent sugar dehydrogenase [Polyangia bacterium]|nr:PQQ-dependent sugar dehydrogenase [Polyangia bacterium]